MYKKKFWLPHITRAALRMQAGYRGGTYSPHCCLPGSGHQLEAAAAVALAHLCHPGEKNLHPRPNSSSWTRLTKHTEVTTAVPRASSSLTWVTSGSAAQMLEGNIWHWFHWSWEKSGQHTLGILRQGTRRRGHTQTSNGMRQSAGSQEHLWKPWNGKISASLNIKLKYTER